MAEQTIASLTASLASAHKSIATMQTQVRALDVRVTAVEDADDVVPPVTQPPATTDSPDLTTISPGGTIVFGGKTYTVAGGKASINGTAVANTSGVVTLKLVLHPLGGATPGVYQNNGRNWYGPVSPASGGAQVAGDPSVTAPVVVPPVVPLSTDGVPAPAAAVGFNKRTLGPAVRMGVNWFPNGGGKNITTNADGSVTLAGPWDYNAQITSGDGHSFGTAFGGGGYFVMDFMWLNPFVGGSGVGWPSWWANSAEGRTIASSPNWPAGAAGNGSAIEWDIFEFFADGWGPTIWDWSANGQVTQSPFNGAFHAQGGVKDSTPTAAFQGARHKIGGLWVPATPTTKGRHEVYLDGALRPAMTQTWDRWSPSVGLPLVEGSTANSIMDFQHFMMLAGSSTANPMIVYGIEIWQRDGSGNLPPT